ncbi:MAG: hypothetical protein J6D47_19530 [Peptostreptococcaceae bacterium]|nr:hypothetical protein [Peptostreptococcaceae bacterium]
MAISKNLEIKINNDQATLSEKFYIYQYDKGIDLYIKINIAKLQIDSRSISMLSELEGARAGVTILKPNGSVIGRTDLEISNDLVKFTIDETLTDELDEVGIYKIQFHLYDGSNNRITIPPVQFEVKPLIGIVPEMFR